jgi:transcriptional regulator with XRE-family HTH domain
MEYVTNIGEKIKKIRDSKKLSQKRFGMKIGVSGKTISAYETGKINPPYKIVEKISQNFNVSIFELPQENQLNIVSKLKDLESSIQDIKTLLDFNWNSKN